ncbi:uncharacterized protein LOC115337911 isoform X8 [Aquila chrysaetos chrysaetos]|uniref:uncharacterized protein LOC115337911 isoform X8 n=1 Tax=Aquila chrysaetos chrysaetos TaxID=223781 RepID=UPI001B7D3B88|nr:uncharacterized protein LOC115337911 isoform X8 [Aquila chrysaetos chrysaetos]XP_040977735.1 uncharacterized protein LOC115337911 isoform X8 [Aquila chrysaetos chrysaetos]
MLGVKHLQRAVRRGDTWVEASPHPCPIPALASRSLKALCKSLLANSLSFPRAGTFSPLFLSSNPAHAHLNQTALLSFSLRTPSSGWDFIHITWELISSPKNRRILTYTLDGCTGKAWNWWEQSCTVSQEVDRSYRQRAGVRPNGTLALRDVRDEDAGTYLVTVRAPDGLACVGVNLSVSREMLAAEWPSILSIIQIAAAGVVLCFLALILGEHMFWRGDKLEKTPGGTCHQSQPPPGDDSG